VQETFSTNNKIMSKRDRKGFKRVLENLPGQQKLNISISLEFTVLNFNLALNNIELLNNFRYFPSDHSALILCHY
jgi:hypothetical protein